jgi:hypothetical protein
VLCDPNSDIPQARLYHDSPVPVVPPMPYDWRQRELPAGTEVISVAGVNPVSKRALEVLRSLYEGLTNPEIAERLGISQHIAKNYPSACSTSFLGFEHPSRGSVRANTIDYFLKNPKIRDRGAGCLDRRPSPRPDQRKDSNPFCAPFWALS